MKYRIPAVCSVALARLPARATEVAYCKASHRVATVALPLSIGAGLKKIRERIGTRRFLVDLEVLGIRQSRDEPFMKATGSFHRESPGTGRHDSGVFTRLHGRLGGQCCTSLFASDF
jgi:hypothetical protein